MNDDFQSFPIFLFYFLIQPFRDQLKNNNFLFLFQFRSCDEENENDNDNEYESNIDILECETQNDDFSNEW